MFYCNNAKSSCCLCSSAVKWLTAIITILFLNSAAYAQVASVYTSTAKIIISSNTTVTIPGNVSINGPSFILNNGTSYIAGNFTNNGSALTTGGTGTTHFNGTTNLSGTAAFTPFYDFIIDPSSTFNAGTSVIRITGTGSFINNGTFNAGTGRINFIGVATIDGLATTFYDVTLSGETTIKRTPTFTDTLQLNNGSSIITPNNSIIPTYTTGSALVYNYDAGSSFTTTKEWFRGVALKTAGNGVPYNVWIKNGNITVATGGATPHRSIAGSLKINSNGALILNASGDLYISGNWTNSGIFTHSNRLVSFLGSADQTISGNTTFYNVEQNQLASSNLIYDADITTIGKNLTVTAGNMSSNPNTTIVFTGTGNLAGPGTKAFNDLQINNTSLMTITDGDVSINHDFINNGNYDYSGTSKTTSFSGNGVNQLMSGTGITNFGNLVVGNDDVSASAINLIATNNYTVKGGSLLLNNGSIFKNTNNTATFSNTATTVSGTGAANFYNALVNVGLNPGSGLSTFTNTLQINPGGLITINAPSYGNAATLIYNTTTASLPTSLEWSSNSVIPGVGTPKNVTILNTNNILLSGDRGLGGNLDVPAANTLNLNNYTLNINGAFTNTGKLIGSASSGLVVGGTAGTVYLVKNSSFNQLKTLTVKNAGSLALGGNIASGDSVNIVAGSQATGYGTVIADGTLTTNGTLTLRSDKDGTAMVAASAGKITGDVTVERYIPARRAWRFVTVPFSSSNQSINQAWQENRTNTSLDCAANQYFVAGYGTQITYNGTNGYDLNTTVNPSIKVWANTAWTTPTSTTGPKITDYKAYCLFVRGDRTVCLINGVSAPANNTILRSTGVLNEPGVNNNDIVKSFTSINAGENVFAGNPYASPIDLYNVFGNSANNSSGIVDGKFAVWDPGIGGNYGVGGYVTVTAGVAVPQTDKFPDAATAAQVQSGEGFFVYIKTNNNTGNANFTFRENNKIANQFNVFNFTGNENAASRSYVSSAKKVNRDPKLYINLLLPTQDSIIILDGTAAVFDSIYSAGIDDYDASKKFNFNENIGLRRDGKSLAIETRPLPTGWDTLYVRTWLIKAQNYTLQTKPENIPPAVKEAWLVDNYLNTKYKLNTTDTSNYTFTANSDTNSYAGRFMIVFRTESRQQQAIAATDNGSNAKTIKALGKVSVSPNPVTRNEDAVLRLNNVSKGTYEVQMFNNDGRKMMARTIDYAGGYSSYPLKINQAWAAGKYNIALVNKQTGETVTLPLIIVK